MISEVLRFATNVKCVDPEKIKQQKVNTLIRELNLTTCADTKVGHFESKGLSGGEKRRLSMAEQVIYEPRIIFLDEVTSGLDSFNALLAVSILKKLTK